MYAHLSSRSRKPLLDGATLKAVSRTRCVGSSSIREMFLPCSRGGTSRPLGVGAGGETWAGSANEFHPAARLQLVVRAARSLSDDRQPVRSGSPHPAARQKHLPNAR